MNLSKADQKRWNTLMRQASGRSGFADDNNEAKSKRKARAQDDILYFAKEYFPDFFKCEFACFHKRWVLIEKDHDKIHQVIAFRGSGKSTFFTLVSAAHAIVYGYKKYLLFASYNETKSGLHTMRLLAELKYNARLIGDFGKYSDGAKSELKLSELIYERHSCMVQAVSIGQDPRGLVYGAYRPDFIRLDDIQEDKRARKRKFVFDTCDWIVAKMIPAMARGYSCIVLSTPLNEGCVAMSLEKGTYTPAVKTHRYPVEKNAKSVWIEMFPASRLAEIKKTVGSLVFEQEYNLIPRRNEDAIFRVDDIRRNAYGVMPEKLEYLVSWTDPSAKQNTAGNTGRDYKASVVVGVASGVIYVLDVRIRNESIKQMIGGMYSLYKKWGIHKMLWEDNGGQALLEDVLVSEAEERGLRLPTKSMTNTVNKVQRVEQTLSARLENGALRFPVDISDDSDMGLLVRQLLMFPDGDHDDGPDALEGAVRMCVEHLRRGKAGLPRAGQARESERALLGFV